MKIKLYLLVLIQVFMSITSFGQFKVIGYLPTWANYPASVNSLQLTKLTHINIAFANPDASGNLIPGDGTSDADLVTVVTAAHAQNVKVFLSIGGAGAPGNTYKNLLSSPTNINNFVAKIISYVNTNNLDGIDVDIEGDVLDGTQVTATEYENFVTALGTALHTNSKLMSSALAEWFGSYVTITAAAQYDWINIMSYDAAIPGTGDPVKQHSSYSLVVNDFNYWNTTKSVAGSKLVIGVPFYGYGWGTRAVANNNEISYCNIVSNNAGAEQADHVGSVSDIIYYNGIPTIQKKTAYALQNASGIMIWQLTEDCNGSKSLLSAIYTAVTIPTAVENGLDKSNKIVLSPNPFENFSVLNFNETENLRTVELTNMMGNILEKIIVEDGLDQVSVGSSLSPGIYFLKIQEGNSTNYLKMVKK